MNTPNIQPWQLQMFQRSIKKQQKLKALLKFLKDVQGKECLLITCGDNNGALNWYFRLNGGKWTWADVSGENNQHIASLLGEPVHTLVDSHFHFPKNCFDYVIAIDVLEHLSDDQPFLREIRRVLKNNGRAVITVPNGSPRLLANRLKWRVGMSLQDYGHTRAGYTIDELNQVVRQAELSPYVSGGYSRFFTEMIELGINYGYVRVLSRKQTDKVSAHIAPVSDRELNQHGAAYRLYSLFFPILKLFSRLDVLLPSSADNAVIVAAYKGEPS